MLRNLWTKPQPIVSTGFDIPLIQINRLKKSMKIRKSPIQAFHAISFRNEDIKAIQNFPKIFFLIHIKFNYHSVWKKINRH